MGQKKLLPSYPIIANGVMTGTNTIASTPTSVMNQDAIGIQVSWTGTPVGTITVQVSTDNVTYNTLTFDPVLEQPAGSASGYYINLDSAAFFWVKISYTNASGVGVFNAAICAKDWN